MEHTPTRRPMGAATPRARSERDWPAVSVVMPVRDEERHLANAVRQVLGQEYLGELELIVALGPSTDGTDRIARDIARLESRVRLVANPAGHTPAGLNAAIGVARHDIVVRVDGHGMLPPDYVRRAVTVLEETGAANVGGVMNAVGETDFERAVARAYTSRVGLGGAQFHVGGDAGPAESVYLGVFRRDVLERLGGYDEHFERAQDWELNHRIRAAGETVWFSPELSVTYRPRSSLGALARQFFCTGQWRREIMRRHPGTASVRYVAPVVVVVAVGAGGMAGLAATVGGPAWLGWGWLVPLGYATAVVAAGILAGRGLPWRARAWLPVVLAMMHVSWGAGFIAGASTRGSG